MSVFLFKKVQYGKKKYLNLERFQVSAFNKNIPTMLFLNDKKMKKKIIRNHVYFNLCKLHPNYLQRTGPK